MLYPWDEWQFDDVRMKRVEKSTQRVSETSAGEGVKKQNKKSYIIKSI